MNIAIHYTEINNDQIQTVNARDLHAFLEIGKDFSTWIKGRIEQYGFAEDVDFTTTAPQSGGAIRGGQNRIDYHMSLDMAKELSMVERNERGKEARKYFIECERLAKRAAAQPKMIDLDDPVMLRGLLSNYAERTQIAEAKVADLTPKAEAYDRLDTSEGAMGLRMASKTLGYPERKLSKWLEVNGWAFRQSGKGPLQAYSQRRKDGWLDHKLNQYRDPATGEDKVSVSLTITAKGIARLAKILPSSGSAS